MYKDARPEMMVCCNHSAAPDPQVPKCWYLLSVPMSYLATPAHSTAFPTRLQRNEVHALLRSKPIPRAQHPSSPLSFLQLLQLCAVDIIIFRVHTLGVLFLAIRVFRHLKRYPCFCFCRPRGLNANLEILHLFQLREFLLAIFTPTT